MGDGVRQIELTDPQWGEIKIMMPLPRRGDPWGIFAPLRHTAWGDQVQVVSAENLSHALHGYATPLMQEIGVAPAVHARRIPLEAGRCGLFDDCVGKGLLCRPGKDVPACYEAPHLSVTDSLLASAITQAWKDGYYVLVAEGEGFSL